MEYEQVSSSSNQQVSRYGKDEIKIKQETDISDDTYLPRLKVTDVQPGMEDNMVDIVIDTDQSLHLPWLSAEGNPRAGHVTTNTSSPLGREITDIKPEIEDMFCSTEPKPDVTMACVNSGTYLPLFMNNCAETKDLALSTTETKPEVSMACVSSGTDLFGNNCAETKDLAVSTKELDEHPQPTDFYSLVEDEKPCISALRAAVEDYNRNKRPGESNMKDSEEFSRLHRNDCPQSGPFDVAKEIKSCRCLPRDLNDNVEPESEKQSTSFYTPQHCSKGFYQCRWCYLKFVHLAPCQIHMRQEHSEMYVKNAKKELSAEELRTNESPYPVGIIESAPHKTAKTNDKYETFNQFKTSNAVIRACSSEEAGCGARKNEGEQMKPHQDPLQDEVLKVTSSGGIHKAAHGGKTVTQQLVSDKRLTQKKSVSSQKRAKSNSEAQHKCDLCNRWFKLKINFENHKLTHINGTPYSCELCGKVFKWSKSLISHKLVHTGETPYNCDMCGRKFSQKSNLATHLRSHAGVTPFKCGVCGKCFTQKHNLDMHKSTHGTERPYSCGVCGKRFALMSALKNHKRKHNAETPHKCDVCGKGFTCSYYLKRHVKIHSPTTLYECDECGKILRSKDNLKQHKLTHSDSKRYSCDLCGKGFIRKDKMLEHKLTHSGETPYECETCGKGFVNSCHLARHQLIHSDEHQFRCDICFKGFHLKQNFVRHQLRHGIL